MPLADLQARVQKLIEPPTRGPADQANREAIRDWFPRGSELGFVHPETHAGLLLRESGDLDLFIAPHTGLRLHKDTQTATLFAQAIQLRAENLQALLDAVIALEALEAFKVKTRDVRVFADGEIRWQGKTLRGEAQEEVFLKTRKHLLESDETTIKAKKTVLDTPVTQIFIQKEALDPKVLVTLEMWQDLQKLSAYLQGLQGWLQSHVHGDPVSGVTTPPVAPAPPPPQLAQY